MPEAIWVEANRDLMRDNNKPQRNDQLIRESIENSQKPECVSRVVSISTRYLRSLEKQVSEGKLKR